MKKSYHPRWTRWVSAFILCASYFSVRLPPLQAADEPAGVPAVELREAQTARQAAEQRSAELGVQLVRAERDLEKERQRYAELLLQAKRLQDHLDQLNLRVAGLLTDQGNAGEAQILAKAAAALELRQNAQQLLCTKVRDFKAYLASILETLQPSAALKAEVQSRYAELTKACDRLELQPPLVAGRGGEARMSRECRVLSVEAELGIVALDAGQDAGIRSGTLWRVYDGEKPIAKLQVVEVRPTLSAAIAVEGSVHRIAAGLLVKLGE